MDIDIIGKRNDYTLLTCENLFGLISGKAEYATLRKPTHLTFWAPVPEAVEVIPKYLYPLILHRFIYKTIQGLWFYRTHLSLFQNMSIKIYTDFFLSSGGYNFKINCLEETQNKSSYLADQFDVIPIAIEC